MRYLRQIILIQEENRELEFQQRLVQKELAELNFRVMPSQTNFIFAIPPIDAADYVNALQENGIIIRYFKGGRTGKYVRITIGTDEEMDAFFKATRKILS